MKTICCFIFSITFSISLFSTEHSVIPLLERTQAYENLPIEKYPYNQYIEIFSALCQKSTRIRAVTYNMLFNLRDESLDEENTWAKRYPRIVQLIDGMKPDVIGVQELFPDQVRDIQQKLGDTFSFFAKPCVNGETNGIFYRNSRFEFVDGKVWYMTTTPEIPSPESLTLVQLKDRKTGLTTAFFNTHLSFGKVNKREFQARFISEKIEPYAHVMPTLFMGDLNTFPHRQDLPDLPFYDGDYIHRIFTRGSFKDAKEVSLLGHLGPIATFTNTPEDGAVPFKGKGTPGVFLDHIYVSNDIQVIVHAVESGTVEGHYPSDHMPVLIDFIINQQK